MSDFASRFVSILVIAILLLTQLMCERTRADEILEIMHAKSSVQVSTIIEKRESDTKLERVCRFQLGSKRIPIACFETTSIERSRLERICMDRASRSKDILEIESVLRSRKVSENCRRVAEVRRDDLLYQSDPE